MADKTGYCQHDAGVLKDDKLSPGAKYKFIQDVKDLLKMGTANAPTPPLPCGPEIPPFEFADMALLENENEYPDFYKNVLGQYEGIAKSLDAKGQFTILPICDPVALAVALDIDVPKLEFPGDFLTYGIALPMLAALFSADFKLPIDLVLKFPDLLKPPIPQINLPDLNFDPLQLPELFKFNGLMFGIPPKLIDVVLNLMLQMPNLIFDLLQLKFDAFCKAVFDAEPFGPFDGSKATTWMASQIVLTRKTAECVVINATGSTVGSSSGGLTGQWGTVFGYTPPPPPATEVQSIRNKIVETARNADGYAWSGDRTAIANSDWANVKYMQLLWPSNVEEYRVGVQYDKAKMWSLLESVRPISTCGVFARACLRNGGARGTSYYSKLETGQAENAFDIVEYDARRTGAIKQFSVNSMPALKAGDIMWVCLTPQLTDAGHMLIITSDYNGGFGSANVEQIAGGQTDVAAENMGYDAFAIGSGTISEFSVSNNQVVITYGGNDALRYVKTIIDSEILVKGTQGTA